MNLDKIPFPKSWKPETKPHQFCPGCGHGITLKVLGEVIDELGIQNKTVLGFDIGCSLLAGDLFNVDSLQTHHGRTTPTMVGFKKANPQAISIAYMGDGGAYAIGAQHLINSAMRDDKITCIVVNNTLYAMTGGQMAPTTLIGEKTDTTPFGRKPSEFGYPLKGPEMITSITEDKAYVARTIVTAYHHLKTTLKRAILNQMRGYGFSFVEVLSTCPTNWKTDALESIEFLEDKMASRFPVREFKNNTLVDKEKESD
jgi:2-oxoglutarate ferredoxin oxidoreductase subunit beta